jgi:hypothetical protein
MIESVHYHDEKESILVVVNECVLIDWNPETSEVMYHAREGTDAETAKTIVDEFFVEMQRMISSNS